MRPLRAEDCWSAAFGEPQMSEVIQRATGEVHFGERCRGACRGRVGDAAEREKKLGRVALMT